MTDRHRRFLLLFALANAGGFVAYVPLLTLVLPARIGELAGDARIEWLGVASLVGASTASLGNLAFGWASDILGTRRMWAAAGLVMTVLSYALLHFATSVLDILFAIVAYQLALNMLLAPMVAWAADVVPDSDKGLLGGLLAAGPPAGALAGVLVTMPAVPGWSMQLALICVLVIGLTGPLLGLGRCQPRTLIADDAPRKLNAYFDFGLLWFARLLVQIAWAVLFTFLLYFFQSQSDPPSQFRIALLSAATLLAAFPATLVIGRVSDRIGPRRPFLMAAALVAAIGLLIMAWKSQSGWAMAGYAIFGCATACFLALHSAFSMQLLPSRSRHGRDLAVLNLANTLPNLIAPALAIWLVPGRGFGPLLTLLAMLIVLAAVCVHFVRNDAARGEGRRALHE